jgi:hypothetical protein
LHTPLDFAGRRHGALRAPPGGAAAAGLDVPYVPTPPQVVAQMLALAGPTRNDVLYDLGSGDGRIVIEAARRFGTRGVGVDLNPVRVEEASANARRAGVQDRVRFRQQDLFETDLRPASIVTLYLLPASTWSSGRRCSSSCAPAPAWCRTPSTWATGAGHRRGGEVSQGSAGRWCTPGPSRPGGGDVDAHHPGGTPGSAAAPAALQRFTGPGVSGRLVGDRIDFTLTERVNGRPVTRRFSGRVTGGAMSGRSPVRGAWRAVKSAPGAPR